MERPALLAAMRAASCGECTALLQRPDLGTAAFSDLQPAMCWTEHEWLVVLRNRLLTTQQGGVRTRGIEASIARLERSEHPDRKVGRATLTFADETWLVLHVEADIVACFSVARPRPRAAG